MRSPELTKQTMPSSESHRHSIGETPLFEALKLEYLKNQGESDIEPVVSQNGAGLSMLLEGVGSETARDTYRDIWATTPENLTEADAQVYLEQSYQAAQNEDTTFQRPAAIYVLDTKTVWNASTAEGTTGLALVSDKDSIRLGSEMTSGVIDGPLLGDYKLVIADNTLFNQLEQNSALTIDNISRLDDNGERDLYPFYSAVIIDSNSLYGGDKKPKHRMSEGQKEAVARTVTSRQQAVREKLGLPLDATEQQVKDKWKENRLRRQSKPSTEKQDETPNEEQQPNVSDDKTFVITDKRVRSRKELLFASLDQLSSDFVSDEPVPEVTGPIAVNRIIPPKPDHDPTTHLNMANENEQNQSSDAPAVAEQSTWKDKISYPFRRLASQMSAYHAIQRNKLEERYTSEQLSERQRKQVKALKAVWGATALALVLAAGYKLGMHDTHGLIDPSDIPLGGGRQSSDPIPVEKIPAPVRPPEFSVAASTVTNGEGWYQTIQETTGVTDPARQAAILQKIGPALQEKGWAYIMPDGKWGISHPGTLPKDVLELIKNSR